MLEFKITNFKAFAEPASIPIKPITLIFGKNSSGKSSIFQSLLLLKQTLAKYHNENIALFPKGNLVDLGSFRDFISNHDVNRSFSFNATLNSIDLVIEADFFEYPRGGLLIHYLHKNFELLDKIARNETIGINISFSLDHESSNVFVSYIDLYIGDDPHPIITYKKIGWGISDYKFKGNFNHKFWKKFWESFDAEGPKDIEEIIQEEMADSVEKVKKAIKAMSEEEKKRFKEELLAVNGEEDSTKPFPEIQDSIKRDETNSDIKDKLEKLKGYERAIEAYKFLYNNNNIQVIGFLPNEINDTSFGELADKNAKWAYSRDVSLFLLAAASSIRQFFHNIIYIAPLREYPERYYIYGGSQVQHVGLSGKMVPDILFNDQELLSKVNEELKRFGSDYELRISRLSSGEYETREVFALHLKSKITGVTSSLRDVGFGFSQVLPIIVQSMLSENNILLIEQPELHLHPALQAELGSLFAKGIKEPFENKYIIETHSEHLILRIQKLIREGQITHDDVSVIYIDKTPEGSICLPLRLDEEGDFIDEWPGGFFEESYKEIFS